MNKQLDDKQIELLQRANQYSKDLIRYAKDEAAQGHLSPTDLTLLNRIIMFLREDIAKYISDNPDFDFNQN